jgi:hypothetical protein
MGEISLMLKEAGYVNGDMPVIYEPLPDGLTMAYPKSLIPNTVTSVYRAMTNAGFVMQLLRDDRAQENVITIYVGKKPDISN